MNRGSEETSEKLEAAAVASMRPRFMNRGSHPGRVQRQAQHRASMRPRFMNRGSTPWLLKLEIASLLQ